MTARLIPGTISAVRSPRGVECRVYERHTCDLTASCQPTSGRSDDIRWPATILDISSGGIRLSLRRRFEPGALLAIELNGNDPTDSYTGIAKVVRVKTRSDVSWELGCRFLSDLSTDELQGLLAPPTGNRAAEPDVNCTLPAKQWKGNAISKVLVQLAIPKAEPIEFFIKRLNAPPSWPVPRGKIMTLFGGTSNRYLPMLRLEVVRCFTKDGIWNIQARLLNPAPAELLKALQRLPENAPASRI